ncbi:hypothetical protein BpHYR1_027297 [Brachionus plicatilis]|uniref:Uncharacterized protein n=1 Tax=Brachionus plicatilis TaxID=10195 RepID=A0A3M7Q232_BRAPC|nr:hypothetical protein BpHYR1_027297 [Brachionus plicatilis]
MQRHNLEHIIGAGAILNLAHVKFNLTCVACAKTHRVQNGTSEKSDWRVKAYQQTQKILRNLFKNSDEIELAFWTQQI